MWFGYETQSVSAAQMSEEPEEVKWSAELEVALFHSMHGHKPVGENGSCRQSRLLDV